MSGNIVTGTGDWAVGISEVRMHYLAYPVVTFPDGEETSPSVPEG